MSSSQRSRGVGKIRNNHVTSKPVAKKKTEKPERPAPLIDHTRNTWSVKMAARWAGVPERTLYRMLRAGIVPCIPMGESQTQEWPSARDGKRRRTCYRFLIPRQSFIRAWETLGIDTTAA
jgi:hypothetical protein